VPVLSNFRLKVFRMVAERRSFRRAAEELYLTQPAVSSQIHALEGELAVQLFDRTASMVAPTAAGELLLRYVLEVDDLLARAEQELAALQGDAAGELALGASTTIAQYVLPQLLGAFYKQYPRIRLRVTTGNTELVVDSVLGRKAALGLIEGPVRRRDLKTEPFMADEIVMIVPASHEWADETAVAPQRLLGAPLLLREHGSGSRRVVELALQKCGLKRKLQNVSMELDSTESIKSAVEAGLGIGFVSRRAIRKELELGSLRAVALQGIEILRQFSLVYAVGPEPQGPAGAFRRFALGQRESPTSKSLPAIPASGAASREA
jgi:DNA-binding transcriptional LysR family regulator